MRQYLLSTECLPLLILWRCILLSPDRLLNERSFEEELRIVVQYVVVDLLLHSLDRVLDEPTLTFFDQFSVLSLDVVWLL